MRMKLIERLSNKKYKWYSDEQLRIMLRAVFRFLKNLVPAEMIFQY